MDQQKLVLPVTASWGCGRRTVLWADVEDIAERNKRVHWPAISEPTSACTSTVQHILDDIHSIVAAAKEKKSYTCFFKALILKISLYVDSCWKVGIQLSNQAVMGGASVC